MTNEELIDLRSRMQELDKQLSERASLYRLMGATEIADEFERLRTAELAPMIEIVGQ